MADEKKKPQRDHLNDLLTEWAPTINMHIAMLSKNLPPHIDKNDLYAAGMHGLIDAFHKYNPNMGSTFKSYVGKRIQGKIKDHISAGGPNTVDKYFYTQAKKHINSLPTEVSEVKEIKPDAQTPTPKLDKPE